MSSARSPASACSCSSLDGPLPSALAVPSARVPPSPLMKPAPGWARSRWHSRAGTGGPLETVFQLFDNQRAVSCSHGGSLMGTPMAWPLPSLTPAPSPQLPGAGRASSRSVLHCPLPGPGGNPWEGAGRCHLGEPSGIRRLSWKAVGRRGGRGVRGNPDQASCPAQGPESRVREGTEARTPLSWPPGEGYAAGTELGAAGLMYNPEGLSRCRSL